MKSKRRIIACAVVIASLILVCIPLSIYARWIDIGQDDNTKSEDEIYEQMKNADAEELIAEIIELEKELPNAEDKTELLPYLSALIEKSGEFSEEELISLIKQENTDIGLENALVTMYARIKGDPDKLFALLEDKDISAETKAYIVSAGDLTLEHFISVFERFDDSVSVIAMKHICNIDSEKAYELACNVATEEPSAVTDEKLISAFLGMAEYFEKDKLSANKAKEEASEWIMKIYDSGENQSVKDQAVYALARMSDYEMFASIIDNEDIDFYLKISAMRRNIDTMTARISEASAAEDISAVITAMKLHPIAEIGDALKQAVSEGKFADDNEILELIKYIEANGVIWDQKEE